MTTWDFGNIDFSINYSLYPREYEMDYIIMNVASTLGTQMIRADGTSVDFMVREWCNFQFYLRMWVPVYVNLIYFCKVYVKMIWALMNYLGFHRNPHTRSSWQNTTEFVLSLGDTWSLFHVLTMLLNIAYNNQIPNVVIVTPWSGIG